MAAKFYILSFLFALISTVRSISPPVATKVPHVMKMFGDVRVDNYYWLRDDTRTNPDILSHLQRENNYTGSIMSETKGFEEKLFEEMKGRVKEDDISTPVRKGQYYYYTKTLKGKEYVQYCRRRVLENKTSVSVYDSMSSSVPEEVLLDVNVKAGNHSYYNIAVFQVSPDNKMVAYAVDTKGNEIYTVYVIDAESGEVVDNPLSGVTSFVEWAGDHVLAYLTMDSTLRLDKLWVHKLGEDQSQDKCLYNEKNEIYSLDLSISESEKFLFIGSESKTTRSIFYIDIAEPYSLEVLTPRVEGIDTSASHSGNHFFIKRRTDEFFNSEILASPLNDTSRTTLLIQHGDSVKIQEMLLFAEHLVLCVREYGLTKITFYRLLNGQKQLNLLQNGQSINLSEPVYTVGLSDSQFSSSVLRFSYESLKTPESVYDYDMNSHVSVLKKISPVLGGFNSTNYITERLWANVSDATMVPISIVYRKNLVKLDGSNPMLLYGYGAYEVPIEPSFSSERISLLDRGFVYAIAHVRGGGEMGRKWYENGKLMKKKNTFTDFIACAEYLIEKKYCSKEKLTINGRSAGGLLMGAVLNMRPDLFKTVVAGVPFVDVLTTMLDPTVPLTTSEWEEWGDPRKEEYYFYMKSYSPVDNVKAQNYPNMLVTAGLNDPRVLYSEPSKLVAKLRDMKTDNNTLLFKCEMGAGHFSKTGRFEMLQEEAFTYTFILRSLNMIPPHP